MTKQTEGEKQMKASILVMDADSQNGALLTKGLKRFDFVNEAYCARTAEEAYQLTQDVDLVLLDPMFPGVSAADFVQTLAGTKGAPGTFIITSYISRDMMHRCIKAGAARCFRKPVDIQTLARAIENWMHQNRSGTADREQQENLPDHPADPGAMLWDGRPILKLEHTIRTASARLHAPMRSDALFRFLARLYRCALENGLPCQSGG